MLSDHLPNKERIFARMSHIDFPNKHISFRSTGLLVSEGGIPTGGLLGRRGRRRPQRSPRIIYIETKKYFS
jgi:hypothetical protein